MVNFDFSTYNNIKLLDSDLSHIKDRFLSDNNMAGWYDLDINTSNIKKCADRIKRNADILIVIGIGGSFLGAKCVIDALTPYFDKGKPEIIFAGTSLSSDYLVELLEYIKGKSVYVNVISKSGTTLEPMICFDIVFDYMKKTYKDYKDRIIATTDAKEGKLLELSKAEGFELFEVPNDIGGRYSVLTPVGLIPIAVAGIDIDKLLDGAKLAKDNLDDCYKYTLIRDALYLDNKVVESFDVYEPKLYYFTEWLKQLFGESQGKSDKGILPISTVNTRDLHSLGQFFQEGNPIIFSTVIYNGSDSEVFIEKYNKNLSDINEIAMKSVSKAHYSHMNTNIITIDRINAENIGYLIFFFEMSAMMGSYLLGVNFYDQPGVNAYKNNIKECL